MASGALDLEVFGGLLVLNVVSIFVCLTQLLLNVCLIFLRKLTCGTCASSRLAHKRILKHRSDARHNGLVARYTQTCNVSHYFQRLCGDPRRGVVKIDHNLDELTNV